MSADRGAALYGVLRHARPLTLNSARVVETALKPHGLTVGMRAVLEILADHGSATVPAIAQRLGLARQGVQRHVDDLVTLGHAETRDNPAHRRSVLVVLTTAGTAALDRIRADELHDLAAMAPECSPAEIATATRVLEALSRDIRRRATGRDGHEEARG